ncbi:MAG TPA: DNA mismatch repair protein MutT, partial [Bacteroidia bacterium]|nr:DNA mismatch repair protein MutT [Bacteroidia bacterium]
ANGPILKGLALPPTCALTNAAENGIDAELSRLEIALTTGLRFIQIRENKLLNRIDQIRISAIKLLKKM